MAAPGLINAAVAASLALAALAVAQQAGSSWQYPTFFNYTISDTSAMWVYSPPPTADDETRHTWNDTFSGSNWTTYEVGQAGVGVSGHFANGTFSPGIYLNFPMTSFQILGDVEGLNYTMGIPPLQVIIDSRTPMNCTPTPGVICSATNLIWAFHKIQVSLYSGNWTVRGIQATTGAAIKVDTLEETYIQTEPFVFDNGTWNPFYNYSGYWTASEKLGGVGNTTAVPYRTLVGENGASVNVTVPPKTAWVVVNGTVRPDSDQFTLNWDPLPPLADSSMLFSAYNAWQAPSVLYAAPLDPESNYTLGIATYESFDSNPVNGTTLGLHSITFYNEQDKVTLPGWSGAEGRKKGDIIGAVVGSVLGAALIGLVIWLYFRNKKRKEKKRVQHTTKDGTSSSTFEVDDDPYIELNDLSRPPPTPYVAPLPQTNGTASAIPPNKAAMLAASSPGHTPLLGTPDATAVGESSADSAQGHTPIIVSPSSQQHLPVGAGGHSPTAPSPVATNANLPGTTLGTGTMASMTAGPVHPIAAELKHGDTLRRPRPQRPVQVAQEEDGGAVDEFELVPPVYNPAWARERRGDRGEGPSRLEMDNLGADPEGVPLSPSVRAPPPSLTVITTPYLGVSGSASASSTPTTATPHTATAHISPLSAMSHGPSPWSAAASAHPPSPWTAPSPSHVPSPLSSSHPPSPYTTMTRPLSGVTDGTHSADHSSAHHAMDPPPPPPPPAEYDEGRPQG